MARPEYFRLLLWSLSSEQVRTAREGHGDEFRKMIVEKVLPVIREQWPGSTRKDIRKDSIQQDNDRSHIMGHRDSLAIELMRDGFDIALTNQPANSPDMNVMNLGFFRQFSGCAAKGHRGVNRGNAT